MTQIFTIIESNGYDHNIVEIVTSKELAVERRDALEKENEGEDGNENNSFFIDTYNDNGTGVFKFKYIPRG